MDRDISRLKDILNRSNYTVAVCGSGMAAESGFLGFKMAERAYEIEKAYGASPEEIFTGGYYNTRTVQFFNFYKKEMLEKVPEPGAGSRVLAAMEKAGRLQCIITANVFEQEQRAGCENVINLHGSVFSNRCPHCGENYGMEEIRDGKGVPHCRKCNSVVRPLVSLYGEMIDSRVMTRTTEEIGRADVLLLLGTTMQSEVFSNYIRYFNGKDLVIIHKESHFSDKGADLVILDEPGRVLDQLGYTNG
ncbi:MAG: NAD-dependent deacetylase [Clostridium sp.]|nr:NAD-dependent deacetylase [Clostridium sp.]